MDFNPRVLTEAERVGLILTDVSIFMAFLFVGSIAKIVGSETAEWATLPAMITTIAVGLYNLYKISHPTYERGL